MPATTLERMPAARYNAVWASLVTKLDPQRFTPRPPLSTGVLLETILRHSYMADEARGVPAMTYLWMNTHDSSLWAETGAGTCRTSLGRGSYQTACLLPILAAAGLTVTEWRVLFLLLERAAPSRRWVHEWIHDLRSAVVPLMPAKLQAEAVANWLRREGGEGRRAVRRGSKGSPVGLASRRSLQAAERRAAALRERLIEKLHPSRFSGMSSKMAAIVGAVLAEPFADPDLINIYIQTDGGVLGQQAGDVGYNHFLGDIESFSDNWRRLILAADLDGEELLALLRHLRGNPIVAHGAQRGWVDRLIEALLPDLPPKSQAVVVAAWLRRQAHVGEGI